MAQVPTTETRKALIQRLWKVFLPLTGITVALLLFAVVYLGYDLVKGKVSPCESIFQQASAGLTTKIEFLKAKGEIKLGAAKVAELSDRAQVAALSLKTCCTVLDAGRINPEQFLECKAKTRTYDERVEDVVEIVRTRLSGGAVAAAPAEDLSAAVGKASAASRELNKQVTQVVTEQELKALKAVPANRRAIDAAEREPNDDALNANLIELGKTVQAAIGAEGDADVFTFTAPPTYRDWIKINVENRSTTLHPHIDLLDAAKANIGGASNTTAGGDVSYEFVATPGATYSARIASHYGSSLGVYFVSVAATKAYDAFEPNDTILTAHKIAEGAPVKAAIMDKNDIDFFVIPGAASERTMTVTLANGSAALHPSLVIYDATKTQIGSQYNSTAGGDVTYTFKAPKGPIYVRVSDHYSGDAGAYTLTVAPQ